MTIDELIRRLTQLKAEPGAAGQTRVNVLGASTTSRFGPVQAVQLMLPEEGHQTKEVFLWPYNPFNKGRFQG